MMMGRWIACTMALTVLSATVSTSEAIGGTVLGPTSELLRPDAPGPGLTTGSDLRAWAQQDDTQEVTLDFDEDSGRAPRRWWAVVASAAWPGLGETLTGYRRGWLMMGTDAGLLYSALKKDSDGDDWEEKYKAFALQHWNEDQWATALNQGRLADWFDAYPAGTVKEDVPLYVSRQLDEREWFENLGKWDVFAWGWREYWDDVWNEQQNNKFAGELYQPVPGDPDTWFYPNNQYMTPLRDEYLTMRGNSNDAYETRDLLVNASLLLRLFSVLQVAYLEGFIGGRWSDAQTQARDGVSSDLVVGPAGRDGAVIGWKVSY